MIIPFNIPFSTGNEIEYLRQAIENNQLSGDSLFSRKCNEILSDEFNLDKCLLTSSCTDALEMCAILLGIKPGDEVIVPAYTFVSTALAFARQGAVIVFADSKDDSPCIDEEKIESLITSKTKAIVPVHYNGMACDMDAIMRIAKKFNLSIIEDAAHAFGSKYKGRLLGTIGHLGCFSFHETKIIHCGEGGLLSINDKRFEKRAEIIWEKGTNRRDFHRGLIQKYEWIDIGSSFLMSDINAAFLYAQLIDFNKILNHRKTLWERYFNLLNVIGKQGFINLPLIPVHTESNYSGFYFTTRSREERDQLLEYLHNSGIQALSHYLDLSRSPYIKLNQPVMNNFPGNTNSQKYQNTLIRLPLYQTLTLERITEISKIVKRYYNYEN